MIADANILTFLISCSTLFLFVHLSYHILANFGGKQIWDILAVAKLPTLELGWRACFPIFLHYVLFTHVR